MKCSRLHKSGLMVFWVRISQGRLSIPLTLLMLMENFFALGNREDLKYNPDGSLDLYCVHRRIRGQPGAASL